MSEIAGNYDRDLTEKEHEKCKNDVLFLKEITVIMICLIIF